MTLRRSSRKVVLGTAMALRPALAPGFARAAVVLGFAIGLPAIAGTLRYAEDHGPAIVNPLFATTMSEARIDELVFEGLFADDAELKSTGRLATSFELAPDLKSMTIQLRKGVTWHDGRPFTADDVVFSVNAYRAPQTASTEAGRVSWIDQATAKDPNTVVLTFKKPEFAPQDKLHFKILPAHKFSSTTVKRTDTFRSQPVGTGPFELKSFNDEDNSISLARHTGHWNAAKLDGMTMREISDTNFQARLLQFESLEALVRVVPRDLATLQNDRKVELYPYQTNSWWYVGFNHNNSTLRDVRVREALSKMVNVDQLMAPIGTGDRVSGPFVPSSPYYNHDVPPVAFDEAGAAELLTKAGFKFNGKWVKPDGKEFKLKIVAISNMETTQDVILQLQSQLQTRGVTVEPEFVDLATWKDKVWRDRNYDMMLSQWSFDRNEVIDEQFHSTGGRNYLGYKSSEVDKLLNQARDATDPQKRRELLHQAHAKISKDHPMIFLWTLKSYAALNTKVRTVVIHPFYFFTYSSDWTL